MLLTSVFLSMLPKHDTKSTLILGLFLPIQFQIDASTLPVAVHTSCTKSFDRFGLFLPLFNMMINVLIGDIF